MPYRRRQVLALCGAGVATTGCLEPLSQRESIADEGDIVTIAHRGSKYLWPENTLESIQGALETGADVVEMDLHQTATGEIVVIHDSTVDRTTDGTGKVDELTLDELKSLDAGYHFPPERSREYLDAVAHDHLPPSDEPHPYRGRGFEIPTLEEVFDAVPSEFTLLLEPKRVDLDVEQLISMIRADGRVETTMIGAFSTDVLNRIRRREPALKTGLGGTETRQFLLTMRASEHRYDPGADFLFSPRRIVRPSLVDRAHRKGMDVLPWTVNDPADIRRLVSAGVDGLVTDDHIFVEQFLESELSGDGASAPN